MSSTSKPPSLIWSPVSYTHLYNALRHILFLTLPVVIGVPVEEQYNIRILLNGAGFTQVGEHGTVILPAVRPSGELGQSDHRYIEFLCHDLEPSGDLRDLQHTVVARAPSGGHQLEVVNHHQADIRNTPELGLDVRHRDGRGIVDVDFRLGEHLGGHSQLGPVLGGEVAGTQRARLDQRLGRKDSSHQLLLAHFQRKDRHLLARAHCHIGGDIQGEGGLAHTGTGRHQDQVGFVAVSYTHLLPYGRPAG